MAAFVQRAALLAVLWWAVAEGAHDSWPFAAPVVLVAAAASVRLQGARPWRLRPLAAARMAAWFLRRSLVAGTDVALRALGRRPCLAPAFVTLHTRLERAPARVLLANALSLVPGTLSTALDGAELHLHLLDRSAPVEQELRELEAHIAALFGERL